MRNEPQPEATNIRSKWVTLGCLPANRLHTRSNIAANVLILKNKQIQICANTIISTFSCLLDKTALPDY